jgi:iron complex transport system substrate-binding protein
MNILAELLLGALIAVSLISCNTNDDTPVISQTQIIDATGEVLSFKEPPTRLISLGPGNTEILFALDAAHLVVGVDDFSDYPIEANKIEKVGAPFPSFDLERIVALAPDLIVSTELADFNTTLRDLGIPVYVSNPQTLEEVFKIINDIGKLIGHSENATQLNSDMYSRITSIATLTASATPRKVFYEVDASDPTRPYTVGSSSFVNDIIEISGGINIFKDVDIAYPQVGLEEVVARDPDVILLADAYAPVNPQSVEAAANRPGWKWITAVQTGGLVPINPDLFSRPGPRLIDGIEYLSKLLHPLIFLNTER